MNAVLIDELKDTVAVVTESVPAGTVVSFSSPKGEEKIIAKDDIPIYHKVARGRISKAEEVIKYGEVIGLAAREIDPGEWVHEHNLICARTVNGGKV